jgi:hypothetical protein
LELADDVLAREVLEVRIVDLEYVQTLELYEKGEILGYGGFQLLVQECLVT